MSTHTETTSAHFAAAHAARKVTSHACHNSTHSLPCTPLNSSLPPLSEGPCDARPTALDIIRLEKLEGALQGKVVLITGCSSGLGLETVSRPPRHRRHVYCTVRDAAKGQAVLRDLLAQPTAGNGKLELLSMEMASLASVRAAAADFLQRSGGRLNVLVANAGLGVSPEAKTAEGYEMQLGVNHLAHFLLFQLLRDALLTRQPARLPLPRRRRLRPGTLLRRGRLRRPALPAPPVRPPPRLRPVQDGQHLDGAGGRAPLRRSRPPRTRSCRAPSPGTEALRHMPKAAIAAMFAKSPESADYVKSPEQGRRRRCGRLSSGSWRGRVGSTWKM